MYTFKNTEINNKKASEFETKSLLYLIGMREDSEEIDVIAIDCFNDVTGANESFIKLWDVQSKNHKTLFPSKIGESLLTLYKNYISEIDFHEYILFIPQLKREYLIDSSLHVYKYGNIEEKQKKGIEKKITSIISDEEGKKPALLDDFLNQVTFVEDTESNSNYIKKLAKFNNKKVVSEELYESIFTEIRNVQSSLKNSFIENETISKPSDVVKFNRHVTKTEIHTLLISRLIGVQIFDFKGVPIPFFPITKKVDDEEAIKDLIQECESNLSRAFFDKSACRCFWKVSEFLIGFIKNNPNEKIQNVYEALTEELKITTSYLTEDTVLYMISLIKTGLSNDS